MHTIHLVVIGMMLLVSLLWDLRFRDSRSSHGDRRAPFPWATCQSSSLWGLFCGICVFVCLYANQEKRAKFGMERNKTNGKYEEHGGGNSLYCLNIIIHISHRTMRWLRLDLFPHLNALWWQPVQWASRLTQHSIFDECEMSKTVVGIELYW